MIDFFFPFFNPKLGWTHLSAHNFDLSFIGRNARYPNRHILAKRFYARSASGRDEPIWFICLKNVQITQLRGIDRCAPDLLISSVVNLFSAESALCSHGPRRGTA